VKIIYKILFLVIAFVLISGCSVQKEEIVTVSTPVNDDENIISEDQNLKFCNTDIDCVPRNCCQSKDCVNIEFKPNCDMIDCPEEDNPDRAYHPEDCLCINDLCVNKNKGKVEHNLQEDLSVNLDFKDYPDFLDLKNTLVVIGDKASNIEIVSASDLAYSLELGDYPSCSGDIACIQTIVLGLTKLPRDVTNIFEQDIISIGSPCVNSISAEIIGVPTDEPDCLLDLDEKVSKIFLFNKDNRVQIIVVGLTYNDVTNAIKLLLNYEDRQLSGKEINVYDFFPYVEKEVRDQLNIEKEVKVSISLKTDDFKIIDEFIDSLSDSDIRDIKKGSSWISGYITVNGLFKLEKNSLVKGIVLSKVYTIQ